MIVVDSFGWIEVFDEGPLANDYQKYLDKFSGVITPTIVIYETYKKLKLKRSEHDALIALAHMRQTNVIDLDDALAVKAAETSLKHKLAMADAIVYTAAKEYGVKVVTSDPHLKDLPDVIYLEQPPKKKKSDRFRRS